MNGKIQLIQEVLVINVLTVPIKLYWLDIMIWQQRIRNSPHNGTPQKTEVNRPVILLPEVTKKHGGYVTMVMNGKQPLVAETKDMVALLAQDVIENAKYYYLNGVA